MSFAVVALLIFAPASAQAQVFPADADWTALPCAGGLMTDLYQDQAGAIDARDIVGNDAAPAGLRATDAEFLYLRMRVDDDPTQGSAFRPFSWGMEIDLDQDTTTYELLLVVDGVASTVSLYTNTTTTLPNNPTDPADLPAVATYASRTHAQAIVAANSSFGSNDDYFVDLAIPWSDLEPLGLSPTSLVFVWAATSSSTNNLDGDFACHDGSTGDPGLSDLATAPTVVDPLVDTDSDGYTDAAEVEAGTDPNDPNDNPSVTPSSDTLLEGGGGCNASRSGSGAIVGLLLMMLLWHRQRPALARRRRRS